MIKIVMADDQVILRESLKIIVEQDSEIKVVGCAGDGKEALKLCGTYLPDLVLMDIMMPNCDGIEGTKLIKEKYPNTKILILTTFNDDENVKKALKNGANGYILKDVKPEELIFAIKSTAMGFGILHQTAYDTVLEQFKEDKAPAVSQNTSLTEREVSVVKLIVDGKSNKEIAGELFLTEGSVKNIITTILEKLELRDRTQLAVYAVKNRLV